MRGPIGALEFDGAYVYLAIHAAGSSPSVVRASLADGTTTTVGHLATSGPSTALRITAEYVYALESVPNESTLEIVRWAKPK